MSKIYVPDLDTYKCFVVKNDTTIRAYKEIPVNNRDVSYRDYFYTSNYLYQDGVQSFGSYSTLPICLDSAELTNSVYYRNDFDKILIIFFILLLICFYFPYKIISRSLGRWLKI